MMAKSKKSTMTASSSAVVFLLLILLYGAIADEEYRRRLRGELLRNTRRAKTTTKTLNCLNDLCLPTTVHVDQARGVRKAKTNEGSFPYDVFEENVYDSVKTEVTVDKNKKSMKARFKPRPPKPPEAAIANPVSVSTTTPPSSPVDESIASGIEAPSPTLLTLSPRPGVVASPWPLKSTDHVPAQTPEAAEPEGNLDAAPKPMDNEVGSNKVIDGDKNDVVVSGQKGGILGTESNNLAPAAQSEDPKENNSRRKTTGFFAGTIVVFAVATLVCFAGPRLREQLRIKRAKKGTDLSLHEKGSITSEDGKSSMDRSFEGSPYVSAQTWTELHFEDFLSSPEDDRASSPLRMLGRSRTSPACMVMRIQADKERSLNSDLSERRRATAMNLMPTFDEYLEKFSGEGVNMPMPSVSPSQSSAEQAPIEHIQFKSLSHLELGSISSMYSSMESESETDDEHVVHEDINAESCRRDGNGTDEENRKVDEEGEQQGLHLHQDKLPLHPQAIPPSPPPNIHKQSPPHSPSPSVPPYPKNTSPRVYPNLPARLSPPPNETPSMEANESVVPEPSASPKPLGPAHRVPTSRAGVDPHFLKMLGKYSSVSMDEDEDDDENGIVGDIQQTRTLVDNGVNNNNEDCDDVNTVGDDVKSKASTTHGGIDPRFLQRIGMNFGNNDNEESRSCLPGDSSSSSPSPPPPVASTFNSKRYATGRQVHKTQQNH